MKRLFIISAFILATTAVSFGQEITGDRNGTLKPGGGELRLVLHITKNADGTLKATLDSSMARLRLVLHISNTEDELTATMDSLDQNAKGLPVTSITRTGPALKF